MNYNTKLLLKFWNGVKKSDDKRLAAKEPITGIVEYNDIPYIDDGSKWHLMDIYRPEGIEGKLPVIIDIHGGGWMYGDKELNKYYCFSLAKRGFAVINISYSLFPNVSLPIPVQDIFAAINHTLIIAEKFGLDTDKIFLTGDSAGGYYAGLVLAILSDNALQSLYGVSSKANFKAVGFTCGALNLTSIARIKLPLAQTLVRMFYDNRKNYKSHPLYKSSSNIANNKIEDFPPMFFNSCDGDFIKSGTLGFTKVLDQKNIPYEMVFYKKTEQSHKLKHVYSVSFPEWPESVETTDKMCTFFLKQVAE